MGRREKLLIDTEVPSSVYALDLKKLSALARIPEVELVKGMQSDDAVDMQGVVVNRGQEVPFEAVGKPPAADETSAAVAGSGYGSVESSASSVKEVLITAASSTMCLENSDTPKCLIKLGEYTLLEHILAQLFVAGMERVVIIISYFGHEIMEHVKDSFLYPKMKIEFLNLGEETPYGHARTLLSAREMFSRPFLIHTADHVFDKSIICRLAAFDLQDCVACVLIDSDKEKLKGLPPTAGKVAIGDNQSIKRIGRGLKNFDAIDAGLFLTTGRLFAALEMLAYEKPKFSLAEALNVLRPSYGLKYMDTAGDVWLSIETQQQYDAILAANSIASLSPWPVFVAKDPIPEQPHSQNVFLAVSAADDDSTLRAVNSHMQSAEVFEGFVVGVNHLEQVETDEDDDKRQVSIDMTPATEATPLLNVSTSSPSVSSPRSGSGSAWGTASATSPKLKVRRRRSSFLEQVEDSFVVSIPLEAVAEAHGGAVTPLTAERNAYLIELPPPMTPGRRRASSNLPGATDNGANHQQFVLAVPDSDTLYKRPNLLRRLSSLPTSVKDVAVETLEMKDGALELQLLVKHQVPVVGYVLLLASLLTISSMGAALDLQRGVDPFLKLFWRSSASFLLFLPLSVWSVQDQGLPPSLFSTRNMFWFLTCCLSNALFLMTFLWALSRTSIDHAYIFNNCHSLLMVLARLALGKYVSQFEGIGTGIGIIGGAITTLDHSSVSTSTASDVVGVSLAGDLVALLGAVGGALYLVSAKKLRAEVDVTVLMCGIFFVSVLLHFPVFSLLGTDFEFSRDPTIGLFGWLDESRFLSETYVVIVCTLVGTLGYVAVMKYFDPIVVSVVMLVEPTIANLMGVAAGVDALPGVLTVIGSLLVVAGTLLVIVSNSSHVDTIDATPAMSVTITAAIPAALSSRSAAPTRKPHVL